MSNEAQVSVEPKLVQYTHWIYGLHALSILIGILTTASIVGKFIFGWPSIIAVIMNYARRSQVRGTWLEGHFRWQIRTFWFALLWVLVVSIISAPFVPLVIGLVMIIIGFAIIGVWALYRVARGWMALRDARPLPLPGA